MLSVYSMIIPQMPTRTPEILGDSIVLVGSFNPTIFQPEWFGRQNLLPRSHVETANVAIVHAQLSQFDTEQFYIQVTPQRFAATTKPSANSAPLQDLVLGTFFVLEHTPVTEVGLNREMHFRMESEEVWHKLGDKLAPKDAWNSVLAPRPGMLTLDVITSKETDTSSQVLVRVQPSVQIPKWGAYFLVNHTFRPTNPANQPESMSYALDTIRNKWEESLNHADKIVDHILDWAAK